jgi:hydrogenase maturation protease
MKTLVLGFGNRSRRDDGAGWEVVERLREMTPPKVELQAVHQLDLAMAETVSEFDLVIFVDAAVPNGLPFVSREVVKPQGNANAASHFVTPSDLITVCATLYGRPPEAMLFTIPARDLNFGEHLSPRAEADARSVAGEIAALIGLLRQSNAAKEKTEAACA